MSVSFEILSSGDTLTFPNPDFGDSEVLDLRTTIKRQMNGQPRTLIKGSCTLRLRHSFVLLSGQNSGVEVSPSLFMDDLSNFIEIAMGKIIKYTDHNGTIRNVKFLKDTLETINTARNASTVTLEMEEVL